MDALAPATIGYVNVFISDFEASRSFYRDTLGLSVATEDSEFGYASFETKGTRFAFARTDDARLVGRHTGIGWMVEDLDSAYDKLLNAGVSFEMTPSRQPWGGYMAMFQDPDGNLFYLDQAEAPAETSFVPADFAVPASLEHELFRLRMLSATDAEADYDAVMASQARLRQGSPHGWPRDGFTLSENLSDLERHEQEFHDRVAFAYTMLKPETNRDQPEVLGCVYINPASSPPPSGRAAEVYMWVRDEYHPDLTRTLFEAVDNWLGKAWPFDSVRYIRTEYYSPDGHQASPSG